VSSGVVAAHQADARRTSSAADRHDPGKPLRRDLLAEMHFDLSGPRRRQLDLRRLQEHGRSAQVQAAMKRITRAARQDAGACAQPSGVGAGHRHVRRAHVDGRHFRGHVEGRARQSGALVQGPIEQHAIDDERFRRGSGVGDGLARRRVEPDRLQGIQDRLARQLELIVRLRRQNARAVDRFAARVVLLEHGHVEAITGQQQRGVQPRGAAADDDHIVHALMRAQGHRVVVEIRAVSSSTTPFCATAKTVTHGGRRSSSRVEWPIRSCSRDAPTCRGT
jgi:hypothetical protein